jgi:hypothetical protein
LQAQSQLHFSSFGLLSEVIIKGIPDLMCMSHYLLPEPAFLELWIVEFIQLTNNRSLQSHSEYALGNLDRSIGRCGALYPLFWSISGSIKKAKQLLTANQRKLELPKNEMGAVEFDSHKIGDIHHSHIS